MSRKIIFSALLLAGCGGVDEQSALHPAGVQAARIHSLWDHTLWICTAVFVSYLGFILVGPFPLLFERGGDHPETTFPAAREARHGMVVLGAVVVSVALLIFILLDDFFTGRAV